MKVTEVRSHLCFAQWRNWLFVEVVTDGGLVGLGEATTEGRELAVLGQIDDAARYLVGKDPFDINEHVRYFTRDVFWVGGYAATTALAAIEIAMWDVIGKALGVPVWQLFGGRLRKRVRVYANGWYFGAGTEAEWAERAAAVVERGYLALKFDPFGQAGPVMERDALDESVGVISAVRAAVGPKVDIMIEGHGRFDVASAIRIGRALEHFSCAWFEEPIIPGNAASLARVAQAVPIPIATGERSYSAQEFADLLMAQSAAIIQPDVIHCGGLNALRRIGALAELWNVAIAPHNPNGPVATAATLAIGAIAPNLMVQEVLEPFDVPWRHEVVVGCPAPVDGFLDIPDRPGLGVELDVQACASHPYCPVDPDLFSDKSILNTVAPIEGTAG